MSKFVVSARKYRPVRFDDVVGQEHVSVTLKNALKNDHLAHAFLFCGPRGVGKTTCARILAKVLNCQNVTSDFEPCNTCSSCVAFNDNASFNITELDAASNNSVEHIRALIEQVRFQPQQGKYKVFIIDEVHMLSQQAFNAFLKTLEEPPPYAIFILATTEKHKIIPTILSRCQIFDFKRIQIPAAVAHLEEICKEEGIEAEKDALHIIAEKADGALRDALSIFDRIVSFSGKHIRYEDVITNLNVLDHDYFFRFVDALLSEDVSEALLIFDDILRKGFDGDIFLAGLSEHLRNVLVCKDPATLPLLQKSDNLTQRFHEQASIADTSFILTALNLANTCDFNYKQARNKRLHVELALIKMAYIKRAVQATPTTAIPEKKTPELSTPVPKVTKPSPPQPQTEKSEPKKETSPSPPSPVTNSQKPATSNQKPATSHQPPATSSGKLNNKLRLGGGVMKLDVHDEAVQSEKVEETRGFDTLTLEEFKEAWTKYSSSLESEYTKSVLNSAILSLESDKVIVTVSSGHAQNTIMEELQLMESLRKELKIPDLQWEIREDKSKKPPPPPKKKILQPRDKYVIMRDSNPLVSKIRERFDLMPDED